MVRKKTAERLARDILLMADSGGIPEGYWRIDPRIARARKILGWTPQQSCQWARLVKMEEGSEAGSWE